MRVGIEPGACEQAADPAGALGGAGEILAPEVAAGFVAGSSDVAVLFDHVPIPVGVMGVGGRGPGGAIVGMDGPSDASPGGIIGVAHAGIVCGGEGGRDFDEAVFGVPYEVLVVAAGEVAIGVVGRGAP